MMVGGMIEALKGERGDGEVLADQLPGLLRMALTYRRTGDVVEVEDLVMAGVRGVLAALRARPGAPGSYLFGAGRRAMIEEARRMLWSGQRRYADAPVLVAEPPEEPSAPETLDTSAQLALIHRRARRMDWEAGLRTWLEEHTLREAAVMMNRSPSVLHERRAALRP